MKEADLKRLYIASIQLYNILEKTNQRIKKHKYRMDWLDLLVVQGTLKSLLQHHSSKASILR